MIDLLIHIGEAVICLELLSIAVLCAAGAMHWRDPVNRSWRERAAPKSSVPRTVPSAAPLARPGQHAKQADPAVLFPLTRGARA